MIGKRNIFSVLKMVFIDMMGGCSPERPTIEEINGVKYKMGITCTDAVGRPLTYNSGTMISGAVDLYRATKEENYLSDAKKLADDSFVYFAKKDKELEGFYSYDVDGFNNWFNGVIMRSYAELYPYYNKSEEYLKTFQNNLDYGYTNHLYEGVLPTNLLKGWNADQAENKTEGMFSFSFGAEYAILARHALEK